MNFVRTLLAGSVLALSLSQPMAREITHALGVTDVPDNPQRIVVMTNEGTEALLAVGITPVGAARSWLGDPWYDHIADAMADVTVLGEESAINLEVLVALEPDLILGNKQRHEAIYEQLSSIAPTVVSERLRGDWQINMALYTDAAGKGDEGKAVLEAFDHRIDTLSQALGEHRSETISIARFMAAKTRIMFKDSFSGLILSEIGFGRPASQDKDAFADDITKERIPEFEADRLIYFTYETGNGEGDGQASDWLDDPLWLNLDVVKAGKVHAVSDAIWNTAGGVIAAHLMLDDLEEIYGLESTR